MARATFGSANSAAMRSEEARRDADIAIAHDQQIVARRGQHAIQTEDLGVRIRRFAGDDQLRWSRRGTAS